MEAPDEAPSTIRDREVPFRVLGLRFTVYGFEFRAEVSDTGVS